MPAGLGPGLQTLGHLQSCLTVAQVKRTSGYVRQVRRVQQAAYPLTKVAADEFVFQPPDIGQLRSVGGAKAWAYRTVGMK